jgi:hypothetical protein
MKLVTTSLSDFIQDFNLLKKAGIICFDANIYFITSKKNIQIQTQVQIVSITNKVLDEVYLLNPNIEKYGFNDTYIFGREKFKYFENFGLYIKSYSPKHGYYFLNINQHINECDEHMNAEIHARMYN